VCLSAGRISYIIIIIILLPSHRLRNRLSPARVGFPGNKLRGGYRRLRDGGASRAPLDDSRRRRPRAMSDHAIIARTHTHTHTQNHIISTFILKKKNETHTGILYYIFNFYNVYNNNNHHDNIVVLYNTL